MNKKRYRVEWKHNGNWRMAINNELTFATKEEAQEAFDAERENSPTLELRIVEVSI